MIGYKNILAGIIVRNKKNFFMPNKNKTIPNKRPNLAGNVHQIFASAFPDEPKNNNKRQRNQHQQRKGYNGIQTVNYLKKSGNCPHKLFFKTLLQK
jgi:hypothetical protein